MTTLAHKTHRWLLATRDYLVRIQQMVLIAWHSSSIAFTALVGLHVLSAFIPVLDAWIIKRIFDQITISLSQNADASIVFLQEIVPFLVLRFVLAIFTQTSSAFMQYFSSEMRWHLQFLTHSQIFGKIISLPGLKYFEDPQFYDSISLASQSLNSGPNEALNLFILILRNIVTLISFIGVLIAISPLLAVVMILVSLPDFYMVLRMGRDRLNVTMFNSPKQRQSHYYQQILSSVTFAKEIRLLDIGHYFLTKLLNILSQIHQSERKQEVRELTWDTQINILSKVVMSIGFAVVVSQALQQKLTLGDLTLYFMAIEAVNAAAKSVILGFSRLHYSLMFFGYYNNLMQIPSDTPTSDVSFPVLPLKRGIEFRHVSFRYSENHPWIFRDFNLFISAGKCSALVGLNGAGKTTLMKLLMRLYDPEMGEILWDDINIRQFQLAEFRHNIRAIFQDFAHFDMTVQENIGVGAINSISDMMKIETAAKKANIHEMIQRLPNGYQTVLSRWLIEDGIGFDLSGGEWQRLAIARMLMSDSHLLILDEPSSALDAQAEWELYELFREIALNRTIILISHRFSTVRMADLIAVIEDGSITETGSHEELIKYEGTYAKLYQMQTDRYN